ncbi:hypothetical protein [Streptomyces sp. NBC_01190]|uniref:hypothetical protein n=1 Tax=Streptomyces sp. NBC_01190 TaxID=2903767 RepID=UPI00386F4341|nr:hypothetical protein OG519_23765 [Streptomyces sp. NBC_01190]
MLILGLLLLACTAAFTGLAIADNRGGGPEHDVTILGHHIATMNGLDLFCAGLALALVFCLGAAIAGGGMSLRRRKSRQLAEARREVRETARERDELAARLETTTVTSAPDDYRTTGTTGDTGYSYAEERDPVADPDYRPATPAATKTPHRKNLRHLFGH